LEKGPALILILALAVLAAGIVRFVHLGHFGAAQALYCLISIPGALVLLLIADYTLHHARLAFLIVLAALIMLSVTIPSFCVGLGLALAGMVGVQSRG
jgi:O-antigen/teichoic acid export membrane protein